MTLSLLQQRDQANAAESELLSNVALEKLHHGLKRYLPGHPVWVYGSILKPGKFRFGSDIDVALEHPSTSHSLYSLQSLLTEATEHPVDICMLEETRLKEKIVSQGQRWTELA